MALKAFEGDASLVEGLGGRDAARPRADDADALGAWLRTHGPNYLRRYLRFAETGSGGRRSALDEHPPMALDVLGAIAGAVLVCLRLGEDARARLTRLTAVSPHIRDVDEDAIDDVWH